MASVYKRLNWFGEPVSTSKLNSMVENMDYLYENMITGYYNLFGVSRNTGLTIRVGQAKTAFTEANYQALTHYYDRPFLPGTKPVIVSGLTADIRARIFYAVKGLDGSARPDHRGFTVIMSEERGPTNLSQYEGEQYYSYLALGPSG